MPPTFRQIAEVASFASARAVFLIEDPEPLPEASLQSYWSASRDRILDWLRIMDATAVELSDLPPSGHNKVWAKLEPVLSEIFVTEMLTRIWGAALTAFDLHRDQRIAEPIARNTTSSHIEARTLALKLLVDGADVALSSLARIDRLRRRTERWTDLLVGHLALRFGLEEFAFDSKRSLEFGENQIREIQAASDEPVWEFVLAGVRLAFSNVSTETAPSTVLNTAIQNSILSSFPADCFMTTGTFRTIQQTRIERASCRAESKPDRRSRENTRKTIDGIRFVDFLKNLEQTRAN